MKVILRNIFIPPVLMIIGGMVMLALYCFLPDFNIIHFPFNLGGFLLIFPGFACMGRSWQIFKKFQTTLYIEKSSCIITEGIFAKTRNPMYIGMILVITGASLYSMNVFSLIIPICFISIICVYFIPLEEKMMLDQFKEKYSEYKEKVPRWL
jgi:protein-S-isoprenylcysteine O-methyltransferase Ste14